MSRLRNPAGGVRPEGTERYGENGFTQSLGETETLRETSRPFWGTGLFAEGAQMVLGFVFETIGVHRLEARSAVLNGRGTGALRKLGAVKEGVLRRSFLRDGEYLDQALWSILAVDWRAQLNTITVPVSTAVH